jgi:hypothetical protein
LDVPLERDDALAKACVAAVERDTRCGELTVAPDCEHAALVEGPGALVAYNCVASAECGKAQACLPARTAVGDEACSVVKSTCGSVNVDRCEHLNLEAGWLRPSVLDALQVCYQRRACPPLVFCVDQWLETVFR